MDLQFTDFQLSVFEIFWPIELHGLEGENPTERVSGRVRGIFEVVLGGFLRRAKQAASRHAARG